MVVGGCARARTHACAVVRRAHARDCLADAIAKLAVSVDGKTVVAAAAGSLAKLANADGCDKCVVLGPVARVSVCAHVCVFVCV